MNTSRLTRAALAVVAAVVICGYSLPAHSATVERPTQPPVANVDGMSAADIREGLAAINDPVAREIADAVISRAIASGEDVLAFTAEPYVTPPGDGVVTRAFPSGCAMVVWISRVSQRIENDTHTACTSGGNWSTAQHQLKIIGVHPFTFAETTVRDKSFTKGAAAGFSSELWFNCPNTNLTTWKVISKGRMNRGGQNYETPWVNDHFNLSQNCGI